MAARVPLDSTVAGDAALPTARYDFRWSYIKLGGPVTLRIELVENAGAGERATLDTVFMESVQADTLEFATIDLDYLTDTDDDGVADLNERFAGTDPDDRASVPAPSTIDVLAVHTPGFAELYDGDPATRIHHVMTGADATFLDSGTGVRLSTVGIVEVAMDFEGGSGSRLLNELVGSSVVNELRESHGADLVALFSPSAAESGTCGIAYTGGVYSNGLLTRGYLDGRYPFLVVFGDCTADSAAHEIGHVLGLNHSFEQAEVGTWRWSRGHYVDEHFGSVFGSRGTVMTYGPGFRDIFSDPDRDCGGLPCGRYRDAWDGADAVASINAVRFQVAAFRESLFDSDGDGLADERDAFPLDPAEWSDVDGDGVGDNADDDADGDDVADEADAFPLDPEEWSDTDGDGIGDNADPDTDLDGVTDEDDAFPLDPEEWADVDGDGIGDNADTDADNDGVEDTADAFPLDPAEWSDSDDDGIGDNSDPDTDNDSDGVPDVSDAFPLDPAEWSDSDGDGIGDNADTDDDGDEVADEADAFPLDAGEWSDADADGIGDNADTDSDNDGVEDLGDAFPLDPAETHDSDGDGVGDNADADDDNDGEPDGDDACPLNPVPSCVKGIVSFEAHLVSTEADDIVHAPAADLDGDGDPDLLWASPADGRIAWHENLGADRIAEARTIAYASWVHAIGAADLDGDGDLDVLAASARENFVAWIENLGGGVFSDLRTIAADAGGASLLFAADMDGDGDADVLTASTGDDEIAWHENLGGGVFSEERVITTDADEVRFAQATDLDGDGDADVLTASTGDDEIAWHENLGGGVFSEERVIGRNAGGTLSVHLADLDGDGDPDVLTHSSGDGNIAWYENFGDGGFAARRAIAAETRGGVSVHAADLDGDGDLDVLSASPSDRTVAWHENLGRDVFSGEHAIATGARGASSVQAADLDGDGDADVIAGLPFENKIVWYENQRIPDADDHGDTPDSATPVGNRPDIWSELAADDTDYFSIEVSSLGTLLIYTSGDADTEGTLFDSDGMQLTSDDDSGAGHNFRIEIEVAAGTWFVAVRGYGGAAGNYALHTSFSDETLDSDNDGVADGDDAFPLDPAEWEDADNDGIGDNRDAFPNDPADWLDTDGDGLGDNADADDDNDGAQDDADACPLNPEPSCVRGVLTFEERVIVAEARARGAYAVDLDGDGDLDALSASLDAIAWYKNGGDGHFSAPRIVTTEVFDARDVYAADLDGDGDADVLSASYRDGKIAWYENLGDGAFSEQRVLSSTVDRAQSVHAADLDGDGDIDVLSASDNSTVAWFENLGAGVFSGRRAIVGDAEGATSLLASDLDGDGDADVLSATAYDGTITWYENRGQGSFSKRVAKFAVAEGTGEARGAQRIHAADLDRDGDIDLISSTAWYENIGGGSFWPRALGVLAGGDFDVATGDLDGDGDADVLLPSAWHENLGGGNFRPQDASTRASHTVGRLSVADLDGDGDDDVLAANGFTLAWHENVGFRVPPVVEDTDDHGDTRDSATPVELPSATPGELQTGDVDFFRIDVPVAGVLEVYGVNARTYTLFDARGKEIETNFNAHANNRGVHVVSSGVYYIAMWSSSRAYVLHVRMNVDSDGDGVFDDKDEFPNDATERVDADGDGLGDNSDPDDDDDGVLDYQDQCPWNPHPTCSGGGDVGRPFQEHLVRRGPAGPRDVYAADLDGDGDADVLSASSSDDKIAWFENQGGGVFSSQRVITTDADEATSVYAADLDGDGDADVLSSSEADNKIAWYENQGGGVFSSQRVITTDADGAEIVHAADLDGDGDADVLWASTKYFEGEDVLVIDSKVAWHENLGGGRFSSQRVITTDADGAESVHAADLDGDGDADVLSASYYDDKIAWYENQGGGVFSSQRVITTDAVGARSVHAADLDGDGDADVLSASSSDDKIAWYENQGGGVFSSQRVITTDAVGARSVHAADLDGDGDADVLSASSSDDKIAWYENQGGGVFSSQRVITTDADVATSVYAADLDGDGDLDLLAPAYRADAILWFENLEDHGNGPMSATRVDAGTATQATLGLGDIDYFRIDLSNPGTLDISTYGTGRSLDSYLTLSDASGTVLSRSDDVSSVLDFARIEQAVASGTYYIAVEGLSASMSGNYVLIVNFEPDRHGDARTLATPVEAPSDTAGSVHAGDVDWFSVDLDVAGSLFIYTSGGVDTHGSLVDVSGMELASDDDSGESYNFRLAHPVAAGVHYVAVRGSSGLTRGDYTLKVRFTETPPDGDGDGVPDDEDAFPLDPGDWRDSDGDGVGDNTDPDDDNDGANDGQDTCPLNPDLSCSAGEAAFTGHLIGTTSFPAFRIHTADLDSDGEADVLAHRNDRVAWYQNLGGGAFSAEETLTGAWGAFAIDAADIDADGDLDVIGGTGTTIAWSENNGGGAFSTLRTLSAEGERPYSLSAVDMDGDGDADLLSGSGDDDILWYENLGGGAFSAPHTVGTDSNYRTASSVHAEDLDGDGDADVLAMGQGMIAWYENLGDGAFSSGRIVTRDVASGYASGLRNAHAADLDGDGDADVLALSESTIAWYENLGGVFSAQRTVETNLVGAPRGIYAADIDGDGDLDVGAVSASSITWYENVGGGAFSSRRFLTTSARNVIDFQANDIDGDGDADMVALLDAGYETRLAWFENLRFRDAGSVPDDHGNTPATATFVGGKAELAGDLAAGDVDYFRIDEGNVALEIFTTGEIDTYGTLTGPTGGALTSDDDSGAGFNFHIEHTVADGAHYIAVRGYSDSIWGQYTLHVSFAHSDSDGDGAADAHDAFPLDPADWFDSDADGLGDNADPDDDNDDVQDGLDACPFNSHPTCHVGERVITAQAGFVRALYAADLDGDGDADVLSAWYNKIAWHENEGGGVFSAERVIATEGEEIHAADLDGDGDADVLWATNDGKVAWYENEGGGIFSTERVITREADEEVEDIHAADFDGDGDADVLWATYGGKVAWHENEGGGVFSAERVIATDVAQARQRVDAVDLDGDGDADVLVAPRYGGPIVWYENSGGVFSPQPRFITTVVNAPQNYGYAADLDGDGDADVLAAAWDGTIVWYENSGGVFSSQRVIAREAHEGVQELHAADLDGDGDADVLVAPRNGRPIAWHENEGGGVFSPQRVIAREADEDVQDLHAADLDGDGDADVLWATATYGGKVAWHDGPGTAQHPVAPGPRASTTRLGPDSTFSGELSAGDVHYFSMDATAYGELRIAASGVADTYGTLYDADWAVLATDDASFGTGFAISHEVQIGIYHVAVRGFSRHTAGSYTLTANFTEIPVDPDAVADSDSDGVLDRHDAFPLDPSDWRDSDGDALGDNTDPDDDNDGVLDGEDACPLNPDLSCVSGPTVFATRVLTSSFGRGTDDVHLSDLDGDGDLDVLAIPFHRMIAWYENLGGGAFSTERAVTTDGAADIVRTADLDGDGDPDVLALAYGGLVAWYENFGGGVFSAERVITTDAYSARSVDAADLDGDGDPDVLWGASGRLAWHENLGNGFSEQYVIATELNSLRDVHASDLDGDGDADVLAGMFGKILWYENQGGGTFREHAIATELEEVLITSAVRAADLDGDGDPDVLAGLSEKVAWYENLGGGMFSSQRIIASDVEGARSVEAADLDGDGDLDVLWASYDSDDDPKIAWQENLGGGSFSDPIVVFTKVRWPSAVRAGDLDGDGDLDVLVASRRETDITWFENLGTDDRAEPVSDDFGDTRGFAATVDLPSDTSGELAAGDVDYFRVELAEPGILDVSVSGNIDSLGALFDAFGTELATDDDAGEDYGFRIEHVSTSGVYYVAVRGFDDSASGSYTLHARLRPTPIAFDRHTIATESSADLLHKADLDGDGDADVLAGRQYSGTVTWYENLGGGLFSTRKTISESASGVRDIRSSDLDGDGDPDVLSASSSDGFAWYENLGAGVFSAQRVVSAAGDTFTHLHIADLDGDGDADVLSGAGWYENLGEGAFSTHRVIATDTGRPGYRPMSVISTAGDLDGDGDLDVVLANASDDFGWYENLGGGAFSAKRVLSTEFAGIDRLLNADLDGDGDEDLLSSGGTNDDGSFALAWNENLGGGAFSEQRVISRDSHVINSWRTALHVTDLDGDGSLDVLLFVRTTDGDEIAWHENLGGGDFSERVAILTGEEFRGAAFTDFDGDGDSDVLMSERVDFDYMIVWYENRPIE